MARCGLFACSRTAVLAAAAAACLLSPATAPAATTLGQLDPAGAPSGSCLGAGYFAQAVSSSPAYAAPAGGGVVTAWSHRANAAAGRELGLRIFRPESGTSFTLVGSSGVQTLAASTVNTFDTRISVQSGDVLGLYVGNPGIPFGGGASCAYDGSGTVQGRFGVYPEAAIGDSVNLLVSYPSKLLNVTARLEADVDVDGFGDETQDGCPTQAGAEAGCPSSNPSPTPTVPSDTTRPRVKVGNRSDSIRDGAISISLTSNEAATATVTGTVSVPNASKVYRLKRKTAKLRPNVPRTVKLKIPKKARRAMYKYLRRGRQLKAGVQIVLKDPAGNTNRVKRKIRLRR
jgi:hypothetical protein